MSSSNNVLIISASNGENLKLAERFVKFGKNLGLNPELLDLTKLNLPLYNPRLHKEEGIPSEVLDLQNLMDSKDKWIICAPEYNGSIPPVFSSAVAWLSVQGDDFRTLFNGRPIGIATFSGGGGIELLLSLRIQLTHLGAQVVGRQLLSNYAKPPKDESIEDLLQRLIQTNRIKHL